MKDVLKAIAVAGLSIWGTMSVVIIAGDSDELPLSAFLFYKLLGLGNLAAVIMLLRKLCMNWIRK